MKTIVVASDSFKGTLSSIEICDIVKEVIARDSIPCNVICVPVADGGEGTVDSFVYGSKAKEVDVNVTGPDFNIVKAKYAILNDTGIIEMAEAAGLPKTLRKDPKVTTTFGVGELIKDAIEKGCNKILLGLGGSATNDAGCGMLAALGVKFYDEDGKEFIPTGGSLKSISRIDSTEFDKKYHDVEFRAMCDVKNPLFGENGAAFIYAPQKGADKNDVLLLDEGLQHFARFIPEEISSMEGSGAAGGMGAGCRAFLKAQLVPGAKAILDVCGFDKEIKDASLVISGEGRLDSQSLQGKLLSELSQRTKAAGVKLVIITGAAIDGAKEIFENAGMEVFETSPEINNKDEIVKRARENYVNTLERVLDKYIK